MSNLRHNPNRDEIVTNLLSWKQWLRILLMVAGGLISWVITFGQILTGILQALFVLILGDDNLRLRKAGTVLAMYQAQLWLYISYATDTVPFPFSDLPEAPDDLDLSRPAQAERKQKAPETARTAAAAAAAAAQSAESGDDSGGPYTDSGFASEEDDSVPWASGAVYPGTPAEGGDTSDDDDDADDDDQGKTIS